MSHVIKLQLEIKDRDLFAQVARDMGLQVTENATVEFYGGFEQSGLAVQLPDWMYQIVVDDAGEVHYDNFNGYWGDIQELNHLSQEYVAAVVEREAVMAGQYAIREEQEDGSLVIRVGGW